MNTDIFRQFQTSPLKRWLSLRWGSMNLFAANSNGVRLASGLVRADDSLQGELNCYRCSLLRDAFNIKGSAMNFHKLL